MTDLVAISLEWAKQFYFRIRQSFYYYRSLSLPSFCAVLHTLFGQQRGIARNWRIFWMFRACHTQSFGWRMIRFLACFDEELRLTELSFLGLLHFDWATPLFISNSHLTFHSPGSSFEFGPHILLILYSVPQFLEVSFVNLHFLESVCTESIHKSIFSWSIRNLVSY